jgi:hypothetical protein
MLKTPASTSQRASSGFEVQPLLRLLYCPVTDLNTGRIYTSVHVSSFGSNLQMRQQLLDAINGGQPFRTVVRDLGLTSNQVWGLTKTDEEWSRALDVALTATRRDDLQHGTNAAYVHGCVLQRMSGASAHQDGQESELIKVPWMS